MKKKIRGITVGGELYQWSISKFNGDGDWGYQLTVWKRRVMILSEWISGYGNGPMTPALVSAKIAAVAPASESQREAAGLADEKSDGQAEND